MTRRQKMLRSGPVSAPRAARAFVGYFSARTKEKMTDIAARIIDWRSQMSALEPHLKGLGGVIQIRLGNDSPGSAFARALRFAMKDGEWPFPWSSVQIDYENTNTHYISDMVQQIRKTAELVVEAPAAGRQV